MNPEPTTIPWRLIADDGVTASFGLAADEALAGRAGAGLSSPTLRLYTYRSHCALVGRFQNVENEIRVDACQAYGVSINRRPTGGGAIIMGADQLGVALSLPGRGEDTLQLRTLLSVAQGDAYSRARELMSQFSEGLVLGLNHLGVEARFRRKNDIEVDGKKIVGLGIYRSPSGGLLFHASLLVDLDVPLMLAILNTPFEKISDKEINTVSARITTVRRETGQQLALDDVRGEIARGYAAAFGVTLTPGDFTAPEREEIATLEREKYLTPGWVNQTTAVPDTAGSAKIKTPAGLLDVRATLAGNTIKAVLVGGDFFAAENAIADVEASLRWHTTQPEKVAATLQTALARRRTDLNGIPAEALIEAVQKAVSRAQLAETQARADPYGCYVNPGGNKQ